MRKEKMIVRLVIKLILLTIITQLIDGQRLIGTHIISRHGERTPSYTYGNQEYDISFWRNGLGQLTVRGQFQQWSLGRYFRQRYSNLINSSYLASEIYVRSTDYDRTLMSAYSNLLGLYPSTEESHSADDHLQSDIWPGRVPWQPVPVHTVPRSRDHLLGVSSCDRYEQLVEQMRKSDRILHFNNEFRDLFEFLEKKTNQTIEDMFIAWDIADSMMIEKIYGLLPSWLESNHFEELSRLKDLCFYHLYFSKEINRLRGAPVIYDILQNIQRLIRPDGKQRKMQIYFAHDISISSTLAFLDVNYVHQPGFASALFFDLYQLDNQSYAVQVEYLSVTDSQTTKIIKLPACPSDLCPLDIFIDTYGHLLPVNMDEECRTMAHRRRLSPIAYPAS